jgi:hypothetical protein
VLGQSLIQLPQPTKISLAQPISGFCVLVHSFNMI